jgi:hypothetical protein
LSEQSTDCILVYNSLNFVLASTEQRQIEEIQNIVLLVVLRISHAAMSIDVCASRSSPDCGAWRVQCPWPWGVCPVCVRARVVSVACR